ncbi:MAG: histidine kinase [Desulfobacterales bacterium]|nr:histidine kinase [Desulfobacterales bacterium]
MTDAGNILFFLETGTIVFFSFGYTGLLFAIAYYGRKRADEGRSIISNPYIYALSLAVYCTAWTFYGSVGRAAKTGLGFFPTYIGPTLMAALGWLVLRKIVRISKVHRITSIGDLIASRYGKSTTLGVVVTIIAVLGIIPYISLQLQAISTTFLLLSHYPNITMPAHFADVPVIKDTTFYVSLLLAVFAILFGTRHLEATERHEGLVAAIAFESVVKLIAFLAVGLFVTYGIYEGFGDIFAKARANPEIRKLFTLNTDKPGIYIEWITHIFLSMMAVIFLPRQFQVAVVENVNEEHLSKAMWLFPLYLLAINIFVLPVTFGGLLHFPDGSVNPDYFVLALPMAEQQQVLALFVYIGGMSAATGMVIVETVALSTMICNDIVVPALLRLPFLRLTSHSDLGNLLLVIRRVSIVMVLLLGYVYFRFIGEFYTLVSIGLISFAAVAQFTPAIIGGIFWKGGNRAGALSGLIAGFIVWAYTLFFSLLASVGLLPQEFITEGPFGIELLKPFQLFGLQGFDHITHAVFWSMLANVSLYIGVSLFTHPRAIEHSQAALFVDVFDYSGETGDSVWRGTASVPDLISLLGRFLGKQRVDEALTEYSRKHNMNRKQYLTSDAGLVSYAEKLLAGAIGSASARVMVSSVVKEEPLGVEEVMDILDETRQVIAYSQELEKATAELKEANERLKELDRLKDEFISTVTHELRTPLTSVRSLAEILHDNPDLDPDQHTRFTCIIIKESERLTRLITQVLDFQKMESGRMEWQISEVDLTEVVNDAVTATNQLIRDKNIQVDLTLSDKVPFIVGDRDRLMQVMLNLISNAVKFCSSTEGIIAISLKNEAGHLRVDVKDNGIGISQDDQDIIFEKFRQVTDASRGRPTGSGLGLTITKRIVDYHNGEIWVKSLPDKGSTFSFTLPAGNPIQEIEN